MSSPLPESTHRQQCVDACGCSEVGLQQFVVAVSVCSPTKKDVEPAGDCHSGSCCRINGPTTIKDAVSHPESDLAADSGSSSNSLGDVDCSNSAGDRHQIIGQHNRHTSDNDNDGTANSDLPNVSSNPCGASDKLSGFTGSNIWQTLQNQLNALITSELFAGSTSAAPCKDKATVAAANDDAPSRANITRSCTRTVPSSGPAAAMAAAASPSLAKRYLREADRAELASVEQHYKTAFDAVPCAETLEAAQRGHGPDYFALKARRVVTGLWQFAKCLPPFVEIPAETQERLLRAALPSCFLLRSARFYDPAAERWTDEHGTSLDMGSLAADVKDNGFADGGWVWAQHQRISREFRLLVPDRPSSSASASSSAEPTAPASIDLAVYALLQAIVLMSPERGDPGRDDWTTLAAVSDGALRYTMLLRCHLEASHSFVLAADLLPELLKRIASYKQFAVPFARCLLAAPALRRESIVADAMAATAAMPWTSAAEISQSSSSVDN